MKYTVRETDDIMFVRNEATGVETEWAAYADHFTPGGPHTIAYRSRTSIFRVDMLYVGVWRVSTYDEPLIGVCYYGPCSACCAAQRLTDLLWSMRGGRVA